MGGEVERVAGMRHRVGGSSLAEGRREGAIHTAARHWSAPKSDLLKGSHGQGFFRVNISSSTSIHAASRASSIVATSAGTSRPGDVTMRRCWTRSNGC